MCNIRQIKDVSNSKVYDAWNDDEHELIYLFDYNNKEMLIVSPPGIFVDDFDYSIPTEDGYLYVLEIIKYAQIKAIAKTIEIQEMEHDPNFIKQ